MLYLARLAAVLAKVPKRRWPRVPQKQCLDLDTLFAHPTSLIPIQGEDILKISFHAEQVAQKKLQSEVYKNGHLELWN